MFSTLVTFDTEYSADSVEWCPAEGFTDLFVCGTYQLVPGDTEESGVLTVNHQKRFGRIYLFQVVEAGKLRLLQILHTAAVLDMKWAHTNVYGQALLGVVNSIGYLQIFQLDKENAPVLKLLLETRIHQEEEEELLALSLDWNTGKNNTADEVHISVSDSKGSISLFKFNGERLEIIAKRKLHDFEAWITAFDYWNPNIIYSGGDDCKFHRLDIRAGLESTGANKVHNAGVTSLHSNAEKEFSLVSGSYDEILRLWDTRNFRRPISETNLRGGIWRLKWDPLSHEKLLAACMYGGFRLIDCKDPSRPKVMEEYNEHGSIAYGCDWSLLPSSIIASKILPNSTKSLRMVATCSFYDHMLKLSSLELPSS